MTKIFLVLSLLICGCGRYVALVPPEAVGPEPVRNLSVVPQENSLVFNFNSAERDARGKALKSLDEYRIYRKQLTEEDNSVFKKDGYELVSTVKDDHLKTLFEAQDQARREGRSPRRVQISPSLTSFSAIDTGLQPNSEYGYRIVGVNQGDVESEKERLVRVLFNGVESEIVIIR